MYGDIADYFKTLYRGKCEIYINSRRLLRKTTKQPDLLVVPAKEADELIAVEAKRQANAGTFSQALGRCIEFKEFAMQTYLAFNEPIPDRYKTDLETVAPKIGLLSRTLDGRITQIRPARVGTPKRPEKAKELKQLLSRYPMYLRAEKRARVEGRKHLASIVKEFREFIEHDTNLTDVKDHWYEPTTNVVHVEIDDSLDDEQRAAEAADRLDGDIQELDLKEKYGSDVRIDLDSEVFSICEGCGHVMAGICRWCGRRAI